MYTFTLLFIFALGSIIGSFLNVVILRRGTGIGFLKGSFCFTCRAALRFYELVPIFSFLAQRGRCRSCRAKIHFQYPLVEALAGFLFVGVWLREMGQTTLLDVFMRTDSYAPLFPHLALLWAIAGILLSIAAYDIRHKIIPDSFVYVFIVSSFLTIFSNFQLETFNLKLFFSHLSAGLVFFLVFAVTWLVSRGKWMGFGDTKLAAGIGLFLGLSSGAAALILSFWIGAAVSVVLLAAKRFKKLFSALKTLTIKSEIPFAPFLILGTFAAYFWNIGFLDIAEIFVL